MKLHLSRMFLLIVLGTVMAGWPGLLVLLTTCTADTEWCPDGGNAAPENGGTPDGAAPRRSEPGDPPPCPPP